GSVARVRWLRSEPSASVSKPPDLAGRCTSGFSESVVVVRVWLRCCSPTPSFGFLYCPSRSCGCGGWVLLLGALAVVRWLRSEPRRASRNHQTRRLKSSPHLRISY